MQYTTDNETLISKDRYIFTFLYSNPRHQYNNLPVRLCSSKSHKGGLFALLCAQRIIDESTRRGTRLALPLLTLLKFQYNDLNGFCDFMVRMTAEGSDKISRRRKLVIGEN